MEDRNKVFASVGAGIAIFTAIVYLAYKAGEYSSDCEN